MDEQKKELTNLDLASKEIEEVLVKHNAIITRDIRVTFRNGVPTYEVMLAVANKPEEPKEVVEEVTATPIIE